MLLCANNAVFANSTQECSIVDDTAETLMQIRQGGFDLGDAEINEDELSGKQIQILRGMIQDIKVMPIYAIQASKDKAFQDFKKKWTNTCSEMIEDEANGLKIADQTK